jgi:amino acid adenylation domain-containing protein
MSTSELDSYSAMGAYEGFDRACERYATAPALQIGSQTWRYDELRRWVGRLANTLADALGKRPQDARIGVLAARSLTAYGGAMAVLATGATLVALNPAYPVERNLAILRRAGISVLLVGEEGLAALDALLAADAAFAGSLTLLVAPESLLTAIETQGVGNSVDVRALLRDKPQRVLARPQDAHVAYIVFTSGSTGEPKGVAITHGNLATYMRNFRALAAPGASDRVATTFELTFDVALHDMLNAWWSGATLVVMPERAMLAPARFILDQRITVWFSVASFAMLLQKQGVLRPGLFPLLRISMLCGEALPLGTAAAWAAAAPNSALYNVWGPTETTMEMAFYRWDPQHSAEHCRRGVVPIGIPFEDHRHVLLDEHGQQVTGAGGGELYVAGPQVGPGYWQDPERTAASFVQLPGQTGIWYKTGDRVERDVLGVYHFVSRVDFMVKVRGHRIELGEVEHALRKASGVDLVAVVSRPAMDGLSQGLVGFVCQADVSPTAQARIRESLQRLLPKAWVPDDIQLLTQMPTNANRKIDRTALAASISSA